MLAPLFQIAFLHDYFADGQLAACRVQPDGATGLVIDRFRLQTRFEQGVFSLLMVWQDDAGALLGYLRHVLELATLRFLLIGDEQEFFQITELPLNWLGQLQLASAGATKTAAGQMQMTPVLMAAPVPKDGAIAVISIALDDLLLAMGQEVRYVVHFQARRVHWLYYLVNRSQMVLKNPAVVGQNGKQFGGPETVVLPGGETALSFSSGEQLFPLRQIPATSFDLVDRMVLPLQSQQQEVEHCLIKGLPTPRLGQLNIARTQQQRFICAMHVYL